MKELTIKIIYDNCKENKDLQEGWGFSALIEANDRKILFDTGNDRSAFFSNTQKMGIDLQQITDVVFSHKHSDHVAGCREILEKLKADTRIYLPKGFPLKWVPEHLQSQQITDFQQVHDGIFSMVLKAGFFLYEQVLILQTPNGLVIVTGCAHPGITNILEAAQKRLNEPIYLILGGFHLFRKNSRVTGGVVDKILSSGVKKVAPCHCSGKSTIQQFKEAYKDDFYAVGAGSVLRLP